MEARKWYSRLQLERAAEALRRNGFDARIAGDVVEARSLVLSLIPEGATVGVGGSVTIRELGVIEELERRGNRVIHHWLQAPAEELMRLRRLELTADVFLASVNAVTIDGKLVSVDGMGNRVAATAFGPKRVVLVAGRNKLARNLEEALWRAKNVAAVLNSRRLGVRTPCAELGYCVDCDSPERICRAVLILERRPTGADYHVVLVNEDLGY
ncbi:MAG: lactate utilization protein [Thermofilaceae archaeon]